ADGELDAAGILELEQHLQDCPACARAQRELQSLQRALRSETLRFAAPVELRRRVRAALPSPAETRPRPKFWNWLTAVTTGAGAACAALLLATMLIRPAASQLLAHELVSSHVRSMMADHALDVASSDQHTVKPWFDGKLDFSPPVKDLAAQEFPLAGGRL